MSDEHDEPPALRVEGIHRAYGGVPALGPVDLEVAAGEKVALDRPQRLGQVDAAADRRRPARRRRG